LAIAAFVLGLVSIPLHAQNPNIDSDYYFANIFAGGGVSTDGTARPASGIAGASAGIGTIASKVWGLGFLEFIETGVIGPLATRNTPTGLIGYDLGTTILTSHKPRDIPFAVAGYSYILSVGNAINYGIGVDHYYKPERAIRLEIRDYYTLSTTHQHNVAIRVAWNFGVHDD
jgi:hypothetical protein